ncbi:unnamed protein product [Linum trigynum]|uniref:Uncharacterized protein n=1 Tax=Linum trigynum TaxID=586398 RepID=A0AAV2FT91_9ROSI
MFVEGKKTPSECDCVIGRTHGLPCSCRINSFKGAGDHFQITHLAPLWSTLDYANPHDARRFEDNDANDLQIFHDLVAEVCRRGPFGQTFLPMIAKPGVARPSNELVLCNTGNHWVRLDFEEDSIQMPPFTFLWTHFRDKMSTQGWEQLFKDERDLYFALGGHHD